MPAEHKTNQSTRLTAAGLIAVTAATLLMMAWAIFPTAALAATTISVNPGSLSAHGCDANEWHFVITQIEDFNEDGVIDEDDAPSSIHVTWANGASADVPLDGVNGHTADYTTTANLTSTVTGATASIDSAWSGTFNLSHGPCGTTTTTTTTTTTVPTTTTETTTTETTTTPTTTTETTTTGTTTPPTTTTETTTTETTTTPTTTTSTTTTGTTSTQTTPTSTTSTTAGSSTTTPTVRPTTVEPSSSTTPPEVAPTTVTPAGTAFTGVENVVPLGAIALMLMTSGSGLLWAGSRRKRDQDQDEE